MRRRNLIGGAAALAFAQRVWAQQPERLLKIGALIAFAENDPRTRAMVAAFAQALEHLGWVAGRNIRIDYRFAAGDQARFKTYAAELVNLAPDAVLASTPPAVAALQQQTSTIPIIFVLVVDPVQLGFVQSLARPGGNITGFSSYDASLMGKWLGLLKEAAPRVTRVGVIFNPDTAPNAGFLNTAIEAAAPVLGVTLTLAPVRDDAGIDTAVAAQAREPGGGLVCLPNAFNDAHRERIIAAALRHGLPLIATSSFPEAGGLMSYWFDPIDLHAQAASYVDRILRGAHPAELPVQQPTKFELVINLKTAKTLGLSVPSSLLAGADEVIE